LTTSGTLAMPTTKPNRPPQQQRQQQQQKKKSNNTLLMFQLSNKKTSTPSRHDTFARADVEARLDAAAAVLLPSKLHRVKRRLERE
jgi:hypothetical protein